MTREGDGSDVFGGRGEKERNERGAARYHRDSLDDGGP